MHVDVSMEKYNFENKINNKYFLKQGSHIDLLELLLRATLWLQLK